MTKRVKHLRRCLTYLLDVAQWRSREQWDACQPAAYSSLRIQCHSTLPRNFFLTNHMRIKLFPPSMTLWTREGEKNYHQKRQEKLLSTDLNEKFQVNHSKLLIQEWEWGRNKKELKWWEKCDATGNQMIGRIYFKLNDKWPRTHSWWLFFFARASFAWLLHDNFLIVQATHMIVTHVRAVYLSSRVIIDQIVDCTTTCYMRSKYLVCISLRSL